VRFLLIALLASACMAHTPRMTDIPCDEKCPKGESCDRNIGECRPDSCEGRCTKYERCVGMNADAHCEPIPAPTMEYTRPDTSAPSSMY
jgi:hypothetical protein